MVRTSAHGLGEQSVSPPTLLFFIRRRPLHQSNTLCLGSPRAWGYDIGVAVPPILLLLCLHRQSVHPFAHWTLLYGMLLLVEIDLCSFVEVMVLLYVQRFRFLDHYGSPFGSRLFFFLEKKIEGIKFSYPISIVWQCCVNFSALSLRVFVCILIDERSSLREGEIWRHGVSLMRLYVEG